MMMFKYTLFNMDLKQPDAVQEWGYGVLDTILKVVFVHKGSSELGR